MTENEARQAIKDYCPELPQNGGRIRLEIVDSLGLQGTAYIFRCAVDGEKYMSKREMPLYAVLSNGIVRVLPRH